MSKTDAYVQKICDGLRVVWFSKLNTKKISLCIQRANLFCIVWNNKHDTVTLSLLFDYYLLVGYNNLDT